MQLPTTCRSSMPSARRAAACKRHETPFAEVSRREPSARWAPSSSRRFWITVISAGCRDRAVWQLDARGRRNCPASTLSAAASLPRRQAPSGAFRTRVRMNVSQPADPQGSATVVARQRQRRSRSWLARVVATGRSGSRAGQDRSASRQRILRVLGFRPEVASGDGSGERSRQVLNAGGVCLPATGLEHDADPA